MSVTLSEKRLFTNVINHYESQEEITLDLGWALNSMKCPYKTEMEKACEEECEDGD